jgi:hypothetical protein
MGKASLLQAINFATKYTQNSCFLRTPTFFSFKLYGLGPFACSSSELTSEIINPADSW